MCFALAQNNNDDVIYKTVDENGVVHYSDKKTDQAKEIILPTVNQMSSSTSKQSSSVFAPNRQTSVVNSSTSNEQQIDNYQISIVTPTNEQTIRDNAGFVMVKIQVLPKELSTNKVQLKINQEVFTSGKSFSYRLENIPRGEHKLTAEIIDQTGKLIAKSEPVTIYLFRPSVIKPN